MERRQSVSRCIRTNAYHNLVVSRHFSCRIGPHNHRTCNVIFLVIHISNFSPMITEDLHSLADGGWYAAVYFLTSTAFLPTWGKIFQKFDIKRAFILALLIFTIGSFISSFAKQSAIFIIGRAVSGMGSGGVYPGAITIIAYSVPPNRRAAYTGTVSSLSGVLLSGSIEIC